MTGFFPIMMFGLPAAALAMISPTKKNMQVVVGTKAELIADEMKKLLK